MTSGCEVESYVLSYIISGLMGRLKSEMGERYHLIQLLSTTYAGIKVRKCIVLLMVALVNKVINKISMFHDEKGNLVPIAELDVIFNEVLYEVSNRKKKLIGKDVVV